MNLPVSPSYALLEAKFYSLIQMDREMRNHLHSQKRIHKRLTNSITMIFSNLHFLFLFFKFSTSHIPFNVVMQCSLEKPLSKIGVVTCICALTQ